MTQVAEQRRSHLAAVQRSTKYWASYTDVSGDGNSKKEELWEAGDHTGSKAAADLVTASGIIKSKAKGETWVVTNISANSNSNS
jgi:hypothetical protein